MGLLVSNPDPANPCGCASCVAISNSIGENIYDRGDPQHVWRDGKPSYTLDLSSSCFITVQLISGSGPTASPPGFYVNNSYIQPGGQYGIAWTYNFWYDGVLIYSQNGTLNLIAPNGAFVAFDPADWIQQNPSTWYWNYTGNRSSNPSPTCIEEFYFSPPLGGGFGGPDISWRGWNYFSASLPKRRIQVPLVGVQI